MDNITVTARGEEITRLDVADPSVKILFLSDIHIDNPWCERRLLKAHLDQAVSDNAVILIAGDLFDAMQGPKDPRQSYRELKESLKGTNYFDRVLDDAVDFFMPYRANLGMVGYGNHEYSVLRHNGTDLIQRFVGTMRRDGSPVVAGGYGGFVRLSFFSILKTPDATMWIYYNHGAGGDAPVSQGAMQTARQAAWLRNCDLVWNGHNHKSYVMSQSTLEPNNKDNIRQGLIYFIRTPGYKNEMREPAHGFAASRNMSPTPRGCVWGDIEVHRHDLKVKYTQDIE